MAALGRNGMKATVYFFYGFPGETRESLEETRRLIRTINDGHERSPVVERVSIGVFDSLYFAAVRQREPLRDVHHRFGWNQLEMTPARAADATLETFVEFIRIPHAPCSAFNVAGDLWNLYDHRGAPGSLGFFRWAKA